MTIHNENAITLEHVLNQSYMEVKNTGNFIDKEKAMIAKLEETKYEMFDGDKNEALDFLSSQIKSFQNYVAEVTQQQFMLPVIYAQYEGQDLRDKVQELDSSRRSAHNTAINAVDILNRFCKNIGIEPFADINTSDRHAVAEFVGKCISEIYSEGIKI